MKMTFCIECGEKITEEDRLEGLCNFCSDKGYNER